MSNGGRTKMILELTSEEVVHNLRLAVHDIDWSVRTISCLGNGGIKYVWQLVQCSERDLLMLKNFGRKSLNEIKATLQSFGFNFNSSLGPEDIKKIIDFHHVPDNDYLRGWLRTTVVELSRFPLDFFSKREEQVLRNRTWATAGKMTFKQLAQLFGVSKALAGAIEKKVLSKLQNHYIAELVDVNYHLLVEFAARCNCIGFTDTCFDLVNLTEQEKIITGSLLGLAIDGLVVDWDRSRLILNEYTSQDIAELKHYFTQSKGTLSRQFITKEMLRGQRCNEDTVSLQNTIHHLKWLAP
jgi:hypothetical protein